MKVRSAVKKICGYCQIIRRGNIVYVRCQKYGRHKQRQGFSTYDKNLKVEEHFCHCDKNNNDSKILKLDEFEAIANKKI